MLAGVVVVASVACRGQPRAAEVTDVVATEVRGRPIAVVFRGSEDGAGELEGVDLAARRSLWKRAMRCTHGAVAAKDGLVVARVSSPSLRHYAVAAFDARTGAERWRTPVPMPDHLIAFEDVVVAALLEAGQDERRRLIALDRETGRRLWTSAPVPWAYDPIGAGRSLLVPARHASRAPLWSIDRRTGAAREIPGGLEWPGVTRGADYWALRWSGGAGSDIVSQRALREGPGVPEASPIAAGPPRMQLVALADGTGEPRPVLRDGAPVAVPAACFDAHFFGVGRDRIVCTEVNDEYRWILTAIWSERIEGDPRPWRIDLGDAREEPTAWTGGFDEWKAQERAGSPWLPIETRFVPMAVRRGGRSRLCVLDVDDGRFSWCSEVVEAEPAPLAQLGMARRGDVHLVRLVLEDAGPTKSSPAALLVLDGATGRFRGAVALDRKAGAAGTLRGAPPVRDDPPDRVGDLLVGRWSGHAFALDLRTLRLAWSAGPRGVRLEAISALEEVERLLGALPR